MQLSADVLNTLDTLAPPGVAAGDRYAAQHEYGDSALPDSV